MRAVAARHALGAVGSRTGPRAAAAASVASLSLRSPPQPKQRGQPLQSGRQAHRWQKSSISSSSFASAAAALAAAGAAAGNVAATSCEAPEKKQKQPPTFEQIAKLPRPGVATIGAPTFLPDGSTVLYLRSAEHASLSRQLYATDTKTGQERPLACTPPGTGEEENLTLEEKLRRERARIMQTGVTSFKVAGEKGSERILVPLGGALYVREGVGKDAEFKRLFDPQAALGSGALLDPQISENGKLVCFVWKDEVYCVPADGSKPPRPLTSGARGTGKTNGLADFLAQEEMDRYEGFWISPDGKQVVYEEVDEQHIPQFRIMHQGQDEVGEGTQEDHRYPFAGKENPKVKLSVVSTEETPDTAAGGVPKPVDFDLTGPFGPDNYLARVCWLPDGAVAAQVMNREQTELAVLRLDVKTGTSRVLFKEKTDVWINVHDMFKPFGKNGDILWANERSGFRHLYVFNERSGMRQITSGSWIVEQVVSLDEKAGVVYYMGTSADSWLERHMFRVALDGKSDPVKITTLPGTHSCVVDPENKTFVDSSSAVGRPASSVLRSLADGKEITTIFQNQDPRLEELEAPDPEFITFPSADGKVTLQAAVYKPDPKKFGPGPYPTVVSCYGGPHVMFCQNAFGMMNMDLRAQRMRANGCLVLKVDNRGSNRRGLHFEGALKHDMGTVEVDDQVAGVRHFVKQGLIDPARVAIYGWSYGGYLSAMCLVKAPDVFKCAVSGAPVTHWDGYDTCYTERYMGLPQKNVDGYKRSAVMAHVKGLKGDLLLVHGLIDENVHFRHTARLINALIAEQKPYQLLLFPNERHSPRGPKDRQHAEDRIWNFIKTSLEL